MIGFNSEFIDGTSKINKVWLDITLSDGTILNLDETRVLLNGVIRDSSTTVDGEFTIGAAVTGKLSVSLDNSDDALSKYDFRGSTIIAWLGGTLSDESVQKVNIGRYYVDEYTYDGANVDLAGYDDLSKFDIPCKGYSWVGSKTLFQLVQIACSEAGVSLYNATIPGPAGYVVVQPPEQWEEMTWHDVISYCAQIAGCFARIIYTPSPNRWRLQLSWYDMAQFNPSQYDGGTFNTLTTPYSDGAFLDGGSFNPWNTGDAADGGYFGDREDVNILETPYDLTVDTDDVMITGVTVELDPSDNIEADDNTKTYITPIYGTAGYVIQISGNPLIETTAQADVVASYLNTLLNGMRFRPMSAAAVENPSLEAGDVAIIFSRNGDTYMCFLSRVTYTVNASTTISCDAASTMQNLKARYSGAQKTRAMIQRIFEKSVSDAEAAMSGIIGALATTMGLYNISETAQDGSTIYMFGDHPTKAASTIIWRFAAGSVMVSSDGGAHWNAALSSEGIAVLQEIYAVKVNADNILTGTLKVGGLNNISGILKVVNGNNIEIARIDYDGIRHGKMSISDILNSGFCLNNDGIIVGTGSEYFQANSNGDIFIRDNPSSGDDYYYTTFNINSNYGSSRLGSTYSHMTGDLDIDGSFTADSKLRVMNTDYGRVSLYCYETPEPSFGDIGEGIIGEDGKCYVEIDPIFSETIYCKQYQVFVQPYCDDRMYVSERDEKYFIVNGNPGSAFGWELKARQIDRTNNRLDPYDYRNISSPELYDELDYIDPYIGADELNYIDSYII